MSRQRMFLPLVIVLPVALYFATHTQPGALIDATGAPSTMKTHIYAGMAVHAESQGSWYSAHIVALKPDGAVTVHFDRWDSRYDEDLPRSRLRLLP